MEVKSGGLTPKLLSKLLVLSDGEAGGIPSVAVKCVDIGRNTSGEGGIQVIITDTDYILEDLPAETEKLWDTITELRKSNIPVEKIWLNYENYTAEIKLNTIQSKDNLKEYLEK